MFSFVFKPPATEDENVKPAAVVEVCLIAVESTEKTGEICGVGLI